MILWYSLICSYCVRCRVPTQKMEDTKRSGTEHMISWFALRRLKCCNRCGKCYLTSKCMLAFRKGKTWRRRKDAIWWYLSMYIIIEGSERPMAKNMIHACRWFISCGLLKSLPLVFLFFFSEVFNAKQRLGQKPVASVANEIGDQKHGHHEARFPSHSCWIFYWPFTSLLYLGSDGPHGHPRRAAIKDWVKLPSQTFTAKAPAWLPSLPSKISSKFLLAFCFRAGKSCLMERLFGAKVSCKICLV